MSATLWTIGYERASLAQLIETLRAARVETLIDVRELPNSRRAGFSKRHLRAGLEEAGLAYVHMRALGTPKAGRDASRRGDKTTMRAIFSGKMENPDSQIALAEVADIARTRRTCLLCFEHDWRACHRAILVERLTPQGFKAVHLEP